MKLTQEYLKSVIEYDPEMGIFKWKYNSDWRNCMNARMAKRSAGTIHSFGYRIIKINGKLYRAGRLAWFYMTGDWPKVVDHIDLDRSNDKFSNLRNATYSQNGYNKRKQSNNTSGYKGVTYHKGASKWMAQIKIEDRYKYLGLFDTAELAYNAYCEAAKSNRGEFARVA